MSFLLRSACAEDCPPCAVRSKKLLGKYRSQYTALGDTFLENLQELTTLKIHQA